MVPWCVVPAAGDRNGAELINNVINVVIGHEFGCDQASQIECLEISRAVLKTQ